MRKTLTLDANLLVMLTVGLTDAKYLVRHKRVESVYTQAHFDVLVSMVERAPALATTTHALTEASNLLPQCAEPMRTEIMAVLAKLISMAREETPVARLVSAEREFVRLGLRDAAFMLLDPARFAILSDDFNLVSALQTRGFEAVHFHKLIFG